MTNSTKCFHLHVDGFFGTFDTLGELADHAADLKKKYPSIIGKSATIHVGYRHGEVEVYSGKNRVLQVSA